MPSEVCQRTRMTPEQHRSNAPASQPAVPRAACERYHPLTRGQLRVHEKVPETSSQARCDQGFNCVHFFDRELKLLIAANNNGGQNLNSRGTPKFGSTHLKDQAESATSPGFTSAATHTRQTGQPASFLSLGSFKPDSYRSENVDSQAPRTASSLCSLPTADPHLVDHQHSSTYQ
jgi:hypothetical protein